MEEEVSSRLVVFSFVRGEPLGGDGRRSEIISQGCLPEQGSSATGVVRTLSQWKLRFIGLRFLPASVCLSWTYFSRGSQPQHAGEPSHGSVCTDV